MVTVVSLDCGRKPEHLEKTHADTFALSREQPLAWNRSRDLLNARLRSFSGMFSQSHRSHVDLVHPHTLEFPHPALVCLCSISRLLFFSLPLWRCPRWREWASPRGRTSWWCSTPRTARTWWCACRAWCPPTTAASASWWAPCSATSRGERLGATRGGHLILFLCRSCSPSTLKMACKGASSRPCAQRLACGSSSGKKTKQTANTLCDPSSTSASSASKLKINWVIAVSLTFCSRIKIN